MNSNNSILDVDFTKGLNVSIIKDSNKELQNFKKNTNDVNFESFSLNYPVVYIHYWPANNVSRTKIYIGETNDLFKRTMQHFAQSNTRQKYDWHKNINNSNSRLIIISNKYFTKSSVLDFEHRLIKLSSANEHIYKVYNGRGNPQGKYFTSKELEKSFRLIWDKLNLETSEYDLNISKNLFPDYDSLIHSAIYKTSPFINLNPEQLKIKNEIINQVYTNIPKKYEANEKGKLIIVRGDAGTGKSILISNTFYDLISYYDDMLNDDAKFVINKSAIIVNHNEQKQLFKNIFYKFLNLNNNINFDSRYNKIVFKSTEFLNQFEGENSKKQRGKAAIFKPNEKYDIVFIDEAHLLLTRKNQSYVVDSSQIEAIRKHAKVIVAVFDNNQILDNDSYVDTNTIEDYISIMKKNGITPLDLKTQWRILPNEKNIIYKSDVCQWIDSFIFKGVIKEFDQTSYDVKEKYIQIFDNPKELFKVIKKKASCNESRLSRIIATYDWDYVNKKDSNFNDNMWWVTIDKSNFKMPWNYEYCNKKRTSLLKEEKYKTSRYIKSISNLTWLEQEHTIYEVGSTYTIQGFDLDYAGLILGNSIRYENNKVVIDPSKSKCHSAVEKNHYDRSKFFLRNQLNVLMKRGVKGLYIYACDPSLRNKLKELIK